MASVGKLAATVAHEINNPLFGILTYAHLVLRGLLKHEFPERDEMADQLRTIERESKRCGDLVKNLLTFSRQAPSNREPNDLNTIVARAISLVKHKLELQSIELKTNLAPGLPPFQCDANQMQQVFLVLMVNASEAMPNGGVLEVATQVEAGAEHCSLRVKDTGGGIPADVMPRIFDPFSRPKRTRTGRGWGWPWRIVSWSSTQGRSRSVPGRARGRSFTVVLPATAAVDARAKQ